MKMTNDDWVLLATIMGCLVMVAGCVARSMPAPQPVAEPDWAAEVQGFLSDGPPDCGDIAWPNNYYELVHQCNEINTINTLLIRSLEELKTELDECRKRQ